MLLLGLPGCWAAGSVGLLFFLLLGLGLLVVWPAAGGLLMLHRSAGCCGLLFGSGQPGCYVMFFFLLFPFSFFPFFFFFFFSFFSSSFQTLAAAVFRPVMRRCRRSSLLSLSSFSPFLFFLFFLLSLLFSFLLSFSSISTTPKVEGVAAALALGSSSPRWPAIQRWWCDGCGGGGCATVAMAFGCCDSGGHHEPKEAAGVAGDADWVI
ncbi:hypothetical protein V6Z11_D12G131300 [Gossypium hirsutum]|uniref:Uncharacterized protein isoform X3 n=1 Tax=Gossypium hirsutum TaxID=3635 RepID=A0A1U8NC40_GOSHI|nr:uncharacterized protein LOC107945870 isoform X3 [Gossypium hirsutum]